MWTLFCTSNQKCRTRGLDAKALKVKARTPRPQTNKLHKCRTASRTDAQNASRLRNGTTQTTKRQEPSRSRFRSRIQGRTTRKTRRAQYGMLAGAQVNVESQTVKPNTRTHLRALRKQLRPRFGARARPRRRRRPSFGRGGLRRLLRLRFQSTSAPSNQYRIPALHFSGGGQEEEELEFTLPRLVGESSREDDAAGRFAPRPRFPPPLPPLRVVTMAAGRRRGRGFVSLSGFPQKARERNGSRSRSLRGFAFCFFYGGKWKDGGACGVLLRAIGPPVSFTYVASFLFL